MAKNKASPRSQRQLRVGEALRHALAQVIERETFRDPDLLDITLTVTEVEASPDLKHATVYVMRLGGGDMTPVLQGLARVKSFLRREIAHRVTLRHVPELHFATDSTFDTAQHIEDLLHRPDVARDLKAPDNSDDSLDEENGPVDSQSGT